MKVELRQVRVDDPLVVDILRGVGVEFSEQIWVGLGNDELVAIWGVIPPTILSTTAYVWFHNTPAIKKYRKTFAKVSLEVLRNIKSQYPTLYGVCNCDSKWLKWLGAEFGDKQPDGYTPFMI